MRKPLILVGILWLAPASLVRGGQSLSPSKIPVILDTDIGTDIDDAFALALILASPELELLGVTTVSGDTQARARLAAKLLWEAGGAWRKVPVYAGEPGTPQPIDQTRWATPFASPVLHTNGAVDFLKREINRHPAAITIIAIGELTNVAAVLESDPSAVSKIKRIALMGGSIARGYAPDSKPEPEWNVKSNPRAAQIVFSSGAPILMAPLDVTAMLQLDATGRRRVFTELTPITNALTILYHLWGRETPTLFDPMAVAMVIDAGLCQTEERAIVVDEQGFTRVVEGKPANVTVGMHTDPEKFFEFYLRRVAPSNLLKVGPAQPLAYELSDPSPHPLGGKGGDPAPCAPEAALPCSAPSGGAASGAGAKRESRVRGIFQGSSYRAENCDVYRRQVAAPQDCCSLGSR